MDKFKREKKILEEAHNNFIKENYKIAQNLWSKILKYDPENLPILKNLSLAYFKDNDLKNAETVLKKIIDINKNETNALTTLIFILEQQDKIEELKKYIDFGLKEKLLDKHWLIKKKIIFPLIFEDKNDINNIRKDLTNKIDEITTSKKKLSFEVDQHLIKPLQFNLSYDHNDNLKINKKCVNLFRNIYPELNKVYQLKQSLGNKIKIGFVSNYFTDHTIGKLFKGIILKLNIKKFDIFVFHSEKTKKGLIFNDFLEAERKNLITNFKLPIKFIDKQKLILNQNLDILFYPEIGLSLELYYLSFIKLAKKQVTSWGHPETTGNNTIDYFLTSKLIEGDNSQKNFSEKLIYTKHLPMYYYTPTVKNKIDKVRLSKNSIYSCPQSLFKIHPDFDLIVGKILKEDKSGVIYFIKDSYNSIYKKVLNRFKKNKDIDIDRIKFLDVLNWEEYINHCGEASVLLDPLYFGSGNSFYESMFYGTPTITKPTNYTKSRLVLGAYNQMEVDEIPVVATIDDYVKFAVKIANHKNLYDLKNHFSTKARINLYENDLVLPDIEKKFVNILS